MEWRNRVSKWIGMERVVPVLNRFPGKGGVRHSKHWRWPIAEAQSRLTEELENSRNFYAAIFQSRVMKSSRKITRKDGILVLIEPLAIMRQNNLYLRHTFKPLVADLPNLSNCFSCKRFIHMYANIHAIFNPSRHLC